MKEKAHKIFLYFNTIKYLKFKQILYRIIKYRNKFYYSHIYFSTSKNKEISNLKLNLYDKNFTPQKINFNNDPQKIKKNSFKFINIEKDFGEKIDWGFYPEERRLWNFRLNSFVFLEDLLQHSIHNQNSEPIHEGYRLIVDWIECNKNYDSNIWDPYVVSERLKNWVFFILFDNYKNANINVNLINTTIYKQADYLIKNLEYYLMANHLLMDAKGLIIAGIYIDEKKIYQRGFELLFDELNEQILPDGAHYERSPSYQLEVIMHLIDVYIFISHIKNEFFKKELEIIIDYLNKMILWLDYIMISDKKFPLVNDASLDYPQNFQDIYYAAKYILGEKIDKDMLGLYAKYNIKKVAFKNLNNYKKFDLDKTYLFSGYYVKKNIRGRYILFDVGEGGPSYNQGHAHADTFNLLLTEGGIDYFIDSGTYTYSKSLERQRFRSTDAHNTITINNESSSQIWSAFRTGERPNILNVSVKKNIIYEEIEASHDGYKRLGYIHKRKLVIFNSEKLKMVIVDTIINTKGETTNHFNGKINFILNPTIGVETISSNKIILNDTLNIISYNYDMFIDKISCSKYFEQLEYTQKISGTLKLSNKNNVFLTIIYDKSCNEDIDLEFDGRDYFLNIDLEKYKIEV